MRFQCISLLSSSRTELNVDISASFRQSQLHCLVPSLVDACFPSSSSCVSKLNALTCSSPSPISTSMLNCAKSHQSCATSLELCSSASELTASQSMALRYLSIFPRLVVFNYVNGFLTRTAYFLLSCVGRFLFVNGLLHFPFHDLCINL